MESKRKTLIGKQLTVTAAALFVLAGCGSSDAAKLDAEVKSHVQGVIKKWKLPLDANSVTVEEGSRGMKYAAANGPGGKVGFSVVCKSSRCIVFEAHFELTDKWFEQMPVPLNEKNVNKIAELLPIDSKTKFNDGQFIGNSQRFGMEFVDSDGRHTSIYVDSDTGKLLNFNEAFPK